MRKKFYVYRKRENKKNGRMGECGGLGVTEALACQGYFQSPDEKRFL